MHICELFNLCTRFDLKQKVNQFINSKFITFSFDLIFLFCLGKESIIRNHGFLSLNEYLAKILSEAESSKIKKVSGSGTKSCFSHPMNILRLIENGSMKLIFYIESLPNVVMI